MPNMHKTMASTKYTTPDYTSSTRTTTEIYIHTADAHRIQEAQRLRFEITPPTGKVLDMRGAS